MNWSIGHLNGIQWKPLGNSIRSGENSIFFVWSENCYDPWDLQIDDVVYKLNTRNESLIRLSHPVNLFYSLINLFQGSMQKLRNLCMLPNSVEGD